MFNALNLVGEELLICKESLQSLGKDFTIYTVLTWVEDLGRVLK